ncbi:GNAT family N-acetyltransferase [Clostridium butyricum]|uniref:Acetyltransferase, GNAT family n=2 Tax=Clostridium butyricum TaxID=1492 RepID=C4IIU0_CLOBU|nr:GNAT family N-acetyltransferase [Clostridium butyricum]APF24766.1 acetyltransferase family protein [Clostridium butyricum]EDT76778.1 acetyltransferase, gnat family [Clostridium butyricum 5521]EEP54561.1 acetyltransferase, GNAT family [Clostridium butyricum E4 str. BoNT E BL5262]NFL32575.1 GNAT family N-acetyltransferase [Clostridium butyricum]NFS19942.1 GNAT family N-acetyltransferase [Clostridium butyricum]
MIKSINLNNIKEVTELFIECFNNPPWNDKWDYLTASRRLTDIVNTPGYFGMSYYQEEKLVGIIMGRSEQYYDGEHFQILEFCISTDVQGKGYGRKLLNEFINELRNRNITNIYLLTLHGKSTEGFYRRNGFISSEDMVLMSKELNDSK